MKAKKFFLLLIVALGLLFASCATQMVPVYNAEGQQIGYTERPRRVSVSVYGYGGQMYNRGYYNQYQYQYQQRPVYQYYPQQQPYYYPQQRPIYRYY
ncbi:MAG TPA: hypothetical protein PLE26_00990 [Candidatus Paceibacterota bacterium]|jgi:hypothetical protein|nr:hypothetical protein [Candidatus Paceibacterota bacterium]HQB56918.1 hypothetical protein [Candidatus Paceibacterota bacterium]